MRLLNAIRSSVARRIHLSFLIAAAVPLIAFALVAHGLVADHIRAQTLDGARLMARNIGMTLYDRFQSVDDGLRILAQRAETTASPALRLPPGMDLKQRIRHLFRVDAHGAVRGYPDLPDHERQQLTEAVRGADPHQPLLVEAGSADRGHRLFLVIAAVARARAEERIAAELDLHYLWDTTEISARMERICVLGSTSEPLFCNHQGAARWLGQSRDLIEDGAPPRLVERALGEPLLTAAWALFLKPRYEVPRWTVVVGVPESTALDAMVSFEHLFGVTGVVAALVAMFLGGRLIRANLGPLGILSDATQVLSKGHFRHRVRLSTGDEFQRLGEAFNTMAVSIGEQFTQQRIYSNLLRALQRAQSPDAAIDAAVRALDHVLGAGRVALVCREHREDGDVAWVSRFAGGEVVSRRGSSTAQLRLERIGDTASPAARSGYLAELGVDTADRLEIRPFLASAHASAELALLAPDEKDRILAKRVTRVLAFALDNLIQERRLLYQATHDRLSGLLNRFELERRFLARAKAARRPVIGMLLIDIDRFKRYSDSWGRTYADRIIIDVAQRLQALLGEGYDIGRFDGDELLVMLSGDEHYDMVAAMAELAGRIATALGDELCLGERAIRVTTTIGGAVYPRHGDDFNALLQSLDAALRHAKKSSRGSLLMFSQNMRDALVGRMELEHALRGAITRGELELYYQPVVDARSRRIVSAEALMRWERPGLGPVSPAEFIDIAEETGLIRELGGWALVQACHQLRRWRQAGYAIEGVSVNVSGAQLAAADFEAQVEVALRESGLESHRLTLEVTETALIDRFEQSAACLDRLRAIGVKVVVDDFGTGYASFKYLKLLPIDGVKIDRLFVKDLPASTRDAAIVAAIVSLARSSTMRLVAEGIETEAQAAFLSDAGVPLLQGFLFARGLTSSEVEAYLSGERLAVG